MTTPVLPVLIIGGGFSGAMLAARLAEKGRASVVMETSGTLARGVAYGTGDDTHRLNVRAANMGALADDPGHFLKWLEIHHPDRADGDAFVSRRLYGQYLSDRFDRARRSSPGLISVIQGTAVGIEGVSVLLSDGRRLNGGAVVIATGNPAPRLSHKATDERIIGNPWAENALSRIQPQDDIFILGTGLTMADMVLGLLHRGWKGRAIALSRRGLLPRPHLPGHPPAPAMPPHTLQGPLSRRLAGARQMARGMEWQRVMDGYRPITGRLWLEASPAERARFLRHLRPWWDVHRHRIAPDIHQTLQSLQDDGRLGIRRGRMATIQSTHNGLDIRWVPSPRASSDAGLTSAQWFLNCTGPAHDVYGTALTASLMAHGRARMEPLGQGLDLDADGRLIGADGTSDAHIFVLGPPSRAAYWESTAVPDIRQRIEALSQLLAR